MTALNRFSRATTLAMLAMAACIVLPLTGCVNKRIATDKGRPGEPTVLLVLTNHSEIPDSAKQTGFWLGEAAHPWSVFRDEGYTVVLTSPDGGKAPIDPRSLQDMDDDGEAFLERYGTDGQIRDTLKLGKGKAKDADVIFFVGGHGAMWDFATDAGVRKAAEKMYNEGGIVAAVCHGPAALVQLEGADGKPLVNNRRVTGFTNSEEAAVGMTDAMPFLLETRLRNLGAQFQLAADYEQNVVVDGRLITGQNPASARGTAQAVVRALQSHSDAKNP